MSCFIHFVFLLFKCSPNYDWIKVGEKDTLTFTSGEGRKYDIEFINRKQNKMEFKITNLNEVIRNVGILCSESIVSFYSNGIKIDTYSTQFPIFPVTLYPVTFKDNISNIVIELSTSNFTYVAFQETHYGIDRINGSFDSISINFK